MQTPLQHCPPEQRLPQDPQCVRSDNRSVSHPLPGDVSQSPQPVSHAEILHDPVSQPAVACAGSHALPQAPQSVTVLSCRSHPLPASSSQSPKPLAHSRPHVPPEQSGVAFGPPLHTIPHEPQFMALLRMFVSQPFIAMPSQLPNPASHEPTTHML